MENIEAAMKRIPPHSIEAEQAVLGAMLMNKDAVMVASEIITGEDFYQTAYGIIFDSVVDLFKEGKPVDLITLQEQLKAKNVPPEISSMEFVKDLLEGTQTSANVKYYAEIVRDKAVLRKLIRINEETANTCYLESQPLEEILEKTEKQVFELVEHGNSQEYVPIRQVVLNALDVIEKASKTKGTVTGIPTGFIDLDYKLSGLQRSDLVLKDGVCAEYRTACGVPPESCGGDLQSRDVKRTAREPSVFTGIPRGRTSTQDGKSFGY